MPYRRSESALTAPLLDRESELTMAETLLAAARAGAGSVLVIEGSAGEGKTRLLREIRERASGVEVLAARAGELESDMAFGVVRQLFEAALARRAPQIRGALLSGAAGPAARLLVTAPDVDTTTEPSDPFQMLHALYWLLANMSDLAPLLLVIDDAHWADYPSLRFVRYLLARLAELPVLVVLATRPTVAAVNVVLAEIVADEMTHVERLAPLSEAATAVIVANALGRNPHHLFTQACHRVSRGNPFLLNELIRELAEQGVMPLAESAAQVYLITPPGVTRAVMVRLARLPDAAKAIAHALAVLEAGRPEDVASLANLNVDTATTGIKALCDANIIDGGRTLRFVHPLVRTSVYTNLPMWQRDSAHRAAARLLTKVGRSLDEAAAHLLVTEPSGDPNTVDLLRRAASAAAKRGAPDIATRYLRRALAEPPSGESRADVLFDCGMAEVSLGDERGIDHLMEGVQGTNNPKKRAWRSLTLADFLVIAGRAPDAVQVLDQAEARSLRDPELSFALRVRRACCGRFDARTYPRVGGELRQLLQVAAADDGPAVRELLVSCALDALQTTGATEANSLLDRALAPPGLMTFHPFGSIVTGMAFATLAYLDRFDEFDALIEAALADVQRRSAILEFTFISLLRAVGDMRRGRLHEVEAVATAALNAVPTEAWGFGGPAVLGPLVAALVERGELRRAKRVLESVGSLDQRVGIASAFLRLNRGKLRFAQGDTASALRDFLDAGKYFEAMAMYSPALDHWRCLVANAYLRLGERETAIRTAEQALAIAHRLAGATEQGVALRMLGMTVGGHDGIELLQQAVAILRSSPARLEFAYALVELGAALRRSNQRVECRGPLRQGLELAHRVGALPLAERAKTELAATGVRPRRLLLSGVDALTVSERRVAELAATGMTNRDIAQALFVTTKTVEKHLNGTYLKFGIHSRAQLAEHLCGQP